jgi:hypothetical protein
MKLPIIPETHQQGMLSIENIDVLKGQVLMDCDFGLQTHDDGRVWVCVNGVALLRFKPTKGYEA